MATVATMTERAERIIKKAETRARLFDSRLDTFDKMIDIAETHVDIIEASQRLMRQCRVMQGLVLACAILLSI
ncbi:MAG: hypothetical protein HXM43_09485 [Lautropia mirabilis]|nr:hypothetical protein [Lautropia mirabilis]